MHRSISASILYGRMNGPQADIATALLRAADSRDARLVDHLTRLINGVYRTAESGLWQDGAARTTAPELVELIAARQIAVASRDGQIVGSVRIHDVADDTAEFGLLVADPDQRNSGIGRALLDFAKRHTRERGLRTMQLELLVPRAWRHPSKEFLKSWYGRRGYRPVRTARIEDAYRRLAPLVATPCDLTIYEKPLQPPDTDKEARGPATGATPRPVPPPDRRRPPAAPARSRASSRGTRSTAGTA